MKSLDKVIEIMDGVDQICTCCAYQYDCDETECIEKTALHYLRKYQIEKNKSGMDRLKEVFREVRGEI